ncbi:hypothetical protein HYFRA_00011081 [Hymenoscyphus fraxineus]|uniref:DUF202 domain-containing protein n=1 Tax=Hymenoscyphus fraxineus TaxID=746836 RepID=A0A9N9L3F4_9HELO|nr:hypothetical protein HYFRA_00011081 [Hymenoscyphus fraxineus]
MAETETSTIASTSKSRSISPPTAIKPVQIQTSQTTPHVDKVNELHETDEADFIHENSRGATELATFAKLRRNYTRASTRYASSTVSGKPSTFLGSFAEGVRKFWRRQISIQVDHHTCRDHLALERTFLGYLRTSLALSMMGVLVAQLFRLEHIPEPTNHFGFYVLGKPLACICQGAAIYSLSIGCFRTWRSQNAIVRGKAISGGFEIVLLALGIFIVSS